MHSYIEYIGTLAGFCTTIAFVPQLIKVLKTKTAKGISTSMYVIFVIGVILWIIYGVYHNSWPLIIANVFTLLFASAILSVKFFLDKVKD